MHKINADNSLFLQFTIMKYFQMYYKDSNLSTCMQTLTFLGSIFSREECI
jgi:hypothetical protein